MISTKGKSKRLLVRFQNEQRRFRLSKSRILRLAKNIFLILKLEAELHIAFVSDAQIRRINKMFHATDRVTDVLAFENPKHWPSGKKAPRFLGEVIISVERAISNSKQFQCTQDEELLRYVVHGILHLLGERDSKIPERKRMFMKQEKIINKLKPITKLIY